MRPPYRCLCCLLIILAATAAAAQEVEVVDGVRHVRNGDLPLRGERTVELTELWRVNVEEEEELIGVVSGFLAGPDGTVWMTDRQLGQILVYSADGEHLVTLSREGEGPGEVDSPDALFWLPDGSLGIKDAKMGQLTHIATDGTPMSSIHLEDAAGESMANSWIQRVGLRGGSLLVSGIRFLESEDGGPSQARYLSVFDLEGRELHQFASKPSGFDFQARTYDEQQNWFCGHGTAAVDAQGRVHVAPERDVYRIEIRETGGDLVGVVAREYEPRRRSGDEIDDMRSGVSMNINGEVVEMDSEFLATDPAIEEIQFLDDGSMWVLTGHGENPEDDGIARSYDVFDAEGRFVEVVHLAVPLDDEQDRLRLLDDGRWIVVENLVSAWNTMYGGADDEDEDALDDDAPLEVVCYRGI